MRLWSLHPELLDAKGLVAVWREGLLAKKVLEEKTKGYKNHPQLLRFKNTKKSLDYINTYLFYVLLESVKRGYHFSKNKIGNLKNLEKIKLTSGQRDYEFNHLLAKLKTRDIKKYHELKSVKRIKVHPLFKIVPGKIETWEITNIS
jgi:hypothetical protein